MAAVTTTPKKRNNPQRPLLYSSAMQEPSPQPNLTDSEPGWFFFSLKFWLLLIVIGFATGISAGLLMKLLRAVQHLAWSYNTGNFLDAVKATSPAHRVLALLCTGALGGPVLWLISRAPHDSGGLSASIWFRSGRLSAVYTFFNAALAIVFVGLGVSLGREGAPKEFGAGMASKLSQWMHLSRAERRLLAACAAGAGMGAVYNVPLGGALFGLEVLLGSLDLPLALPAIAMSMIATASSWLLIPREITYSLPQFQVSLNQIIWAMAAGPLLGLLSVIYIRLISWASVHKSKGKAVLLTPALVFSCLGVLAIGFPEILGNGKDVVQLGFDSSIAMPRSGVLLVLKMLAVAGCIRAGSPGGLFTPTMTCGALAGTLLGRLCTAIWPGPPPGSYALLGAGAVLAAATQGPISAIVLVGELMQNTVPMIVPLLLCIATASIVTRLFESRSIYSGRIPVHLSLQVAPERSRALGLNAETVISAAAPYSSVLEHLAVTSPDQATLHVVDQSGDLVGTISSDTLRGTVSEFGSPRRLATAYDLAARALAPATARIRTGDVP